MQERERWKGGTGRDRFEGEESRCNSRFSSNDPTNKNVIFFSIVPFSA